MNGFSSVIKDVNLMKLEMENDNFTWFGPQGRCSKLDRYLVNDKWLDFGSWAVKAHCRLSSDHKPIHLFCKQISWGPKPFRSFNWWLQEEVLRMLESFWSKDKKEVDEINIQEILKSVKRTLKAWKGNSKNGLQDKMKELKEKLDSLDKNGVWGMERDKTRRELINCWDKHVSMLKQKSRFKWIIQGDRNTKFYNQFI